MAISIARVRTRRIQNAVFVALCYVGTALALTALAAILWALVSKGMGGISVDFFTMSTPAALLVAVAVLAVTIVARALTTEQKRS